MFAKLGIVTNIWAKRLEMGDRFEDLVEEFRGNGFKHMEVRDGDYLRGSGFGHFLGRIESAMTRYTDSQWKAICETMREVDDPGDPLKQEDRALWGQVREFSAKAAGVTFSYAMAHPWMREQEDLEEDNRTIARGKKLAYLLCPEAARLRLVDPQFTGEVDPPAVIANLDRYRELLPGYPVALAVENAGKPATLTLDLAVQGGALLAYDEANTYGIDGRPMNAPAEFWNRVRMETLTSVHLKQKTSQGVSSQIGEGYVDFRPILRRLKSGGYQGDLLLENAPTDQPLEDALQSREYLFRLVEATG